MIASVRITEKSIAFLHTLNYSFQMFQADD